MELTKDDERARRICSLALEFMNTSGPLSSTTIAREFYPGHGAESFRKTFLRDRSALAACGIIINKSKGEGGEALWQADEGLSFAEGAELNASDAAVLDMTCRALLDEPGFPFAEDLRFALAKINRAFSEATTEPGTESRRECRELATLRGCLIAHHAAQIRYVDASGTRSERLIAPYGFFDLREEIYLVAPRIDRTGAIEKNSMRTYNVDRMESVKEVSSVRFDVPPDFCAWDYCRLPFQMGPAVGTATFGVPPERVDDVRHHVAGNATLSDEDGRCLLTASMSSVDDAASWAISQGATPIDPPELVAAWQSALEGCLAMGDGPSDAKGTDTSKEDAPEAERAVVTRNAAGRIGSLGEARELVSLLATLSEAGDSLSAEAVASKLGVTTDRAEKLIHLVLTTTASDERGLPLVEEEDSGNVTLAFSNHLRGRRLRLTKAETLAVAAALERLGVPGDDPLLARINATLSSSDDVSSPLAAIPSSDEDELVARNLEACSRSRLERSALGFGYRKVDDTNEEPRRVSAQGLRHENGLWYLDAFDLDRDQDRTFRVDRMSNPEVLEHIEAPRRQGENADARRPQVTFHDAHYLQLLPWHGLEDRHGVKGGVVASIPYYGGLWLVRMLAACGGTAVTDDPELNAAVRAHARDQLLSAARAATAD